MSGKYASAKYTIAECDRCGFQFKLKKLKNLYIKRNDTNIKVCNECWEPDHPQNMQGMHTVHDAQGVQDPRPSKNLDEQRGFQYGFNPVGLNNPLQLEGLVDNLQGNSQIGLVTVTTT